MCTKTELRETCRKNIYPSQKIIYMFVRDFESVFVFWWILHTVAWYIAPKNWWINIGLKKLSGQYKSNKSVFCLRFEYGRSLIFDIPSFNSNFRDREELTKWNVLNRFQKKQNICCDFNEQSIPLLRIMQCTHIYLYSKRLEIFLCLFLKFPIKLHPWSSCA